MGHQDNISDVVPYDFGVPQRLSREATSGLRRIHEVIARDLEHVFGQVFDHDVRGSVVNLEQTRYQQFVDRLPARGYHAVVAADALAGDLQIVLPGSTALRLVDQLLQTSEGPERNLTLVDGRLIEDYIPRLLTTLGVAFAPYHPLTFSLVRSELNGQLVKLVAADDVVVLIELLFTFGENDNSVIIAYPQKAIVPILASLTQMEAAATAEALERSSPIRQSILRVPVPVTVALPPTSLPAGAVNSLKVGDVLQTGVAADTPPMLMIAGKPALQVRPSTRRNRLVCAVVGEAPTGKGLPS